MLFLCIFAPEASRAVAHTGADSPTGFLENHGGQGTMWEIYSLQKTKVMQQHIYYTKYALQFADMQIPELVNIFNS